MKNRKADHEGEPDIRFHKEKPAVIFSHEAVLPFIAKIGRWASTMKA